MKFEQRIYNFKILCLARFYAEEFQSYLVAAKESRLLFEFTARNDGADVRNILRRVLHTSEISL